LQTVILLRILLESGALVTLTGTVKNNYPLSLISDLINTIGTKRMFTKMDLRWGYNNVWIKERDKWKAAFTTHLGVYEPTVMFLVSQTRQQLSRQ